MKKAQAGHSGPLVVVQWIEVEWGKDARGAEAAARRNQIPTALPLPELVLKPESQIVVYRWSYSDHDHFEKPGTSIVQYSQMPSGQIPSGDLLAFDFIRSDGVLEVVPHPRQTGVGRRPHHILLGEWSQFIWNERIVYESTWRYRQITANISFVSEPTSRLFLDRVPLEVWSELVHLY